jgi:hypothetical protein
MALTGGVAPISKQVLTALQIWRDDINAKGGLLGRDRPSSCSTTTRATWQKFPRSTHEVVVWPKEYRSGDMIYPYAEARDR